MENEKQKFAGLEALLFIHGEPLGMEKIAKVLAIEKQEAEAIMDSYKKSLAGDERGLCVVEDGDRFQLATKPAFGNILSQFIKEELSEELTPASLEALSIVFYLGPISRHRLEYFRGVSSVFTLRNLLLRGLVERFPDPKRPNSYLYKPSLNLVRHLGLNKIQDLPDYQKFQDILKGFENQDPVLTKNEG